MQFKLIEGYGHEVAEDGQVRHVESQEIVPLHQAQAGGAYKQVALPYENTFHFLTIHRLVATAFVENDRPDIAGIVDHIDKNKHNNHASNLRWLTRSENARNCRIKKNNKSGHTGVGQRKNKWYASITIDGKQKRTYFYSKGEAIRERRRLEVLHNYTMETKAQKMIRVIDNMIEMHNKMNEEHDALTMKL